MLVQISDENTLMYNQPVAANGIMCYQCNSGRDPGCSDITRNNTDSSYYKVCKPIMGQTKPFFCRTIVQTSESQSFNVSGLTRMMVVFITCSVLLSVAFLISSSAV
jgi:hypothetical protein